MSIVSIRRQSLWSVTSTMERKLSLTLFPQLFFLLSVGLSINSEDPLGRIWMGRAKEKVLLINSALRGPTTHSLRDPPAPEGRWKCFSHWSPVFSFQGLTVAPRFYTLTNK